MGWRERLFKYRKKREPDGIASVPEGTNGYWGYGINEDGTLRYNKFLQAQLYDLSLARMCIHKIASEVSKATPVLARPNKQLEYSICRYPNQYQTISQFLYQLTTILLTDNNAYIIPIYNDQGKINGLFPASKKDTEIVEIDNELWLRYDLGNGIQKSLVQYEKCGHLKRMQYQNYLAGEDNQPFLGMGALYDEHLEKSIQSVDSADAAPRWIGKLNSTLGTKEQMKAQMQSFSDLNFLDNKSNLMLYDSRFESLDQIKKEYNLLSHDDIEVMTNAAYNYWGVSEAFIQSKYKEDEWYATYQSTIEPLIDQIGETMTRMVYSRSQIVYAGDGISLNRLQYASIQSRIDVAFGAYDRGLITINQALDVLNLPSIGEEGDKRYLRGEYYQQRDERGTSPDADSNTGKEADDGNYRENTEPEPDKRE